MHGGLIYSCVMQIKQGLVTFISKSNFWNFWMILFILIEYSQDADFKVRKIEWVFELLIRIFIYLFGY